MVINGGVLGFINDSIVNNIEKIINMLTFLIINNTNNEGNNVEFGMMHQSCSRCL